MNSAPHKHTHARLFTDETDRIVPTFAHSHGVYEQGHQHLIETPEELALIPPEIVEVWRKQWDDKE
jgi:hypothetical protein